MKSAIGPPIATEQTFMRAICWHGKGDVRVDTVPDPKIEDPRDAIVRITSTCICGSDLHLYDGYMPTMEAGDVLGHEPMGVVEEVGKSVTKLKPGDRVVVPGSLRTAAPLGLKKMTTPESILSLNHFNHSA
jgi:threonine dehydrogenase-like Zn-dependent dehydrogenase